MKKILIILFLLFGTLGLSAQTMSIDELEAKWRKLYHNGCTALDSRRFSDAEEKFVASINLLESNEAVNSKYHIYALIKLGETYNQSRQSSKLESTNQKLLNIKRAIRPGSKRHVEYQYNLGVYYSNIGRLNEALAALDEALGFYETLSNMEGFRSKVLHQKSLCHYWSGDIQQAIKLEKEAISNDFNSTPDYYQTLAFYYYKSADWANLDSIIKTCYNYSREPILRKFYQSKAKDRASFWSTAGPFFTEFLPSYAYEHPSEQLVSYAYNSALFSKGVLLAAENKSNELTLNSNDEELVKLYNRYLLLKGKKNRTLDEEFEMEALSDVVLRYQKEHKNEYRKDFRITWTDVQAKLQDSDIAIEFITVPNENGNDDYAALYVKKGMSSPKLVRLSNFEQYTSVPKSRIYTTSDYYRLVWGPLENAIEDAQNIYFSPAGIFYNTGIEYLPNEDEINLNATRNIYRLSSTKELVTSKSSRFAKCALFGGIDYNTKVSILAQQSPNYDSQSNESRAISLDSLDLRGAATSGGFNYLPGTLEEIGNIAMSCLESDITADMYSGDEGSETAIKNLSGTNIDVLHIATHGFYYADKNVGRKTSLENLFNSCHLSGEDEYIQPLNEDKMLTRSGLILAGGNNILKRIALPKGVEDGILYADEVSSLNLSRINILVLSACQSGLGDVAASEGVFGLQRGFKLAGVNTIIMSLWKVHDEATQILMTHMYENISSGQTTGEALRNAQFALRMADGGRFDDPEYWAGFIVLDSLN